MEKFDGLSLRLAEPRGFQFGGTWRRYRQVRELRRRVERSERRLEAILHDFVDGAASGDEAYRFEIEFTSSVAPWRRRRNVYAGRVVHELTLYVPRAVQFHADEADLEDTLRRWLAVAIQEEFPELAGVEALREPVRVVPLLELSCVKRAGRAGRRDPDVDAYVLAAGVLCDLARPLLAQRPAGSSWPVLELMPTGDVLGMEARQWGRAYAVPAAGASALEPEALADRVAGDFQEALRLRGLEGGGDLDALAAALGDHWRAESYALSLSTSVLRRSGHDQRLLLEFVSGPRGSKIRPVVKTAEGATRGDWQHADGGSEGFLELEPGVGYSWLADGRVLLNAPMMRPARQRWNPTAKESRPPVAPVATETDCWALVGLAREAADDPSLAAIGDSLLAHLAELPASSLREFALVWARWDEQLCQRPILEAATAVLGFVSDDVFDDVRGWVILQGAHTFNAVVTTSDVLRARQFEDLDQVEDVVSNIQELSRQVLGGDFLDGLLEESRDTPGDRSLLSQAPRNPARPASGRSMEVGPQ